jgi:hypothetical protein
MTVLYVNGDSHSAGAEALNSYCFAQDDPLYWRLGRTPHPDNLAVSYGCLIANELNAILDCQAESASSNTRIIRTTKEYLANNKPDLVIIGWSTWEREEWLDEDQYYQVTASGTDDVPKALHQRYKEWVIAQDHAYRERKLLAWHEQIWAFHKELEEQNIKHLFFNSYSDFSNIRSKQISACTTVPNEYQWGNNYVDPYDATQTYYFWCLAQGFKPVNPNSYHFGADAHQAWADFLFSKYVQSLLTS